MSKNVGRLDAWFRGGFAIALFVLAAVLNRFPVVSLVAAFFALVLMGTALTGYCPLYRALGADSRTHRT